MACQNSCNSVPTPSCGGNNALIILVLYILLAILLGSLFVC